MDDTQLRRLWQQHTRQDAPLDALAGLDDAASAQQREAAVAAMAEDARLAELGRVVVALRTDADQLASELAQRQAAGRQRRRLRPVIGFALAASAAMLAVIVLPRGDSGAELAPAGDAPASLFVASFEEAPKATAPAGDAASAEGDASEGALFAAGFDS
jgi:hypothetical protein